MAGVGFFGRLANLWRGFLSLWIKDIEIKHPEIAYENSIRSLAEKYNQLKRVTAAIINQRTETEARLKTKSKELAQIEADLQTAVETEQDDIALVLIQKKNVLEAEVADLRAEFEQAAAEAEDAKTQLLAIQAEINKLKTEKDQMLAKMKSAEARIQVQEQLNGFSIDNEVKALENVRDHVKNLAAQANLGKELQEASLDSKLARLRLQTGDVTARKQLEEMKAKLKAKQASQQKTM